MAENTNTTPTAPNSANVSASKPAVGGAVFSGAKSATLPTDATTALTDTFKGLGYASEDGIVNSLSEELEKIKAFGGDIVHAASSGKEDTFTVTLIEATNVDVLKEVFGAANVTGTLATGITVKANSKATEVRSYIFDFILKDGTAKRITVPCGMATLNGEITYSDTGAIGYSLTISCMPDAAGNTHYEYMKAPTT